MADPKKPAVATAASTGLAEQALSVLLTHAFTAAGGSSNNSDADLLARIPLRRVPPPPVPHPAGVADPLPPCRVGRIARARR